MVVKVRLVVPRRLDGGHRDRVWDLCRWYWRKELPDAELVEGEHVDGPFNRSAAVDAAAEGDWDVAVILDADVILDAHQVLAGIERAATSGRMVLPFRHRLSVNRAGTRKILDGFQGSWARWVEERQDWNVSTCVVVPRRLWDEVDGFDDRFVGWGGEDEAFHAACLAIGGGVDRLAGDAWHLWHERAPWRDAASPEYRMTLGLSDRYVSTCDPRANRRRPDAMRCTDPTPMRRLLAEPRSTDQVVLVCLTNGRRDTLAKTIHSADEMLRGPIGRKVIVADGCDPLFDGWDTVRIAAGGYTKATAKAYDVAIASGQPWVFFLEDDFTFPAPVDVAAMQRVMDDHPELVQLSLLRQAWYDYELAAGGIIEAKPDAFMQREGFVEHRDYWTQNPMLARRSLLARHRWPQVAGSERAFGNQVFRDRETCAGIVGRIGDPPRCVHIGEERAGRGY